MAKKDEKTNGRLAHLLELRLGVLDDGIAGLWKDIADTFNLCFDVLGKDVANIPSTRLVQLDGIAYFATAVRRNSKGDVAVKVDNGNPEEPWTSIDCIGLSGSRTVLSMFVGVVERRKEK